MKKILILSSAMVTAPLPYFVATLLLLSLAACSPQDEKKDVSLLTDQELAELDGTCRASGSHATDAYCQQVIAVRNAKLIQENQRKMQELAAKERATNVPSVKLF